MKTKKGNAKMEVKKDVEEVNDTVHATDNIMPGVSPEPPMPLAELCRTIRDDMQDSQEVAASIMNHCVEAAKSGGGHIYIGLEFTPRIIDIFKEEKFILDELTDPMGEKLLRISW